MDINATIIGQFITFAILVWFTMKYVWPPILKMLHDREKKIAAGLEAAEQSRRELEMAEHQSASIIRDARREATQIIDQANKQSVQLIEEAREHAKVEGQRIVSLAQDEIEREVATAKETLKTKLATLAVTGAEKLIQKNLDPATHRDLLDQLAAEI